MIPTEFTLDRALVFFDCETTGTNPETDRLVEVALIRFEPGPLHAREGQPARFLVNPGVPIPAEATAVHGFTDADVADCPPFSEIALALYRLFRDADLAGFGIRRFDCRLLVAEFQRAGGTFSLDGRRIIDALSLFHQREPRDLSAAVRFYLNEGHVNAHGAQEDVDATVRVLLAQLQHYELPRDVAALHALCTERKPHWLTEDGKIAWVNGAARVTFGKNAGRTLTDLAGTDRGFLDWIVGKDFAPDVKHLVREALAGRFPVAP